MPLKMATEDKQSPDSCWTGTYQADTYGTECPQIDPITHKFAGEKNVRIDPVIHEIGLFKCFEMKTIDYGTYFSQVVSINLM